MANLAVIPARGGSVRIPRKNITDFNGRPLIAYSIDNALKSGLFDKVIVSTEDAEIAAVAKEYGAEVPFMRDAALADHYTGTFAVTADAVKRMQEEQGESYEMVCCIYATAPLLTPEYLKRAWQLFNESGADAVMACCEYNFPIQRSFYTDSEMRPHPFMPDCMPMRSQDLKKAVHDAGQFYIYRDTYFKGGKALDTRLFMLPRYRVLDIDTPEDLVLAKMMYRCIQELGLD